MGADVAHYVCKVVRGLRQSSIGESRPVIEDQGGEPGSGYEAAPGLVYTPIFRPYGKLASDSAMNQDYNRSGVSLALRRPVQVGFQFGGGSLLVDDVLCDGYGVHSRESQDDRLVDRLQKGTIFCRQLGC
jgi:hypothetical protein